MRMIFHWTDMFEAVPRKAVVEVAGRRYAAVVNVPPYGPVWQQSPGVPSDVQLFELDQNLEDLFAQVYRIYRCWRDQYDAGLSDTNHQPHLRDPRYQELTRQIEIAFAKFTKPVFSHTGSISPEDTKWVFVSQ